jgi:hypothetical protein
VVGLVDSQNDVTNQPKRVFLDAILQIAASLELCAEAPKAKALGAAASCLTRMNRCGTVRGRGLETE